MIKKKISMQASTGKRGKLACSVTLLSVDASTTLLSVTVTPQPHFFLQTPQPHALRFQVHPGLEGSAPYMRRQRCSTPWITV